MLRLSNYAIIIDLDPASAGALLAHGLTGAVDRISRPVADYLLGLRVKGGFAEDGSEDALTLGESDILTKRGYMTAASPDEEAGLCARIAKRVQRVAQAAPPRYVLSLTYDCNLRCPYCFQSHFRDGTPAGPDLGTMTTQAADRIFAALAQIDERHGRYSAGRRPAITLYGGEPLLSRNRAVVERLVQLAAQVYSVGLGAVTNGTELEGYVDLLGPGAIEKLQITLDGPEPLHDCRRVGPGREPTFSRIVANIDRALAAGCRVGVRINVDRQNAAGLGAMQADFQDRGWTENPLFTAYAARARYGAYHDGTPELSASEFDDHMVALADSTPGRPQIIWHTYSLSLQLEQLLNDRKAIWRLFRSSYCGASTSMYLIDAMGRFFACWDKTGCDALSIGRVDEQSGLVVWDDSGLRRWRSRSVASNARCRQCAYAWFCGGGCAAQAEEASGTMFSPWCDGFPKVFAGALRSAYSRGIAGRLDEAEDATYTSGGYDGC